MRAELVAYLRAELPEALEPLKAFEERLGVKGREACRHACASGRELMSIVADHVYPATTHVREDIGDRPLELGPGKSVNRLVAFVYDELGDDVKPWELNAMGAKLYSAWRRMNDDGLHRRFVSTAAVDRLENHLHEAYIDLISGLALVARAGMERLHRQAVDEAECSVLPSDSD